MFIAMGGLLLIAAMAPDLKVDSLRHLHHQQETQFGDVAALAAAIFYAIYEMLFAKYIVMGFRLSSTYAIRTVRSYSLTSCRRISIPKGRG